MTRQLEVIARLNFEEPTDLTGLSHEAAMNAMAEDNKRGCLGEKVGVPGVLYVVEYHPQICRTPLENQSRELIRRLARDAALFGEAPTEIKLTYTVK